MYIHNIDPIIFSIGPVSVRWYGIIYALGFLITYWYLMNRRGDFNLTKDDIEQYVVHLVVGIVLGSRIGHVLLWNPGYYLSNPLEILMIWKGGLAFHGGLLGALVSSWLWCKKHKVHFWKLADVVAIPAMFALALGRLGNWMNGELWGTVWDGAWCVKFSSAEGCRHPYQIYAFAKHLVIAGMLYGLTQMQKFKDGFIFWIMVLLYGVGRSLLDIVREDAIYYGLKLGQWYSLVMFAVALVVLLKFYRKDLKELFSK